jgi:hypothetical protein
MIKKRSIFGILGEPFKKATTRPSPERPWPPPDGAILPEDEKRLNGSQMLRSAWRQTSQL